MAFTSYTSVTDATQALQDFLYDRDEAIPDDLREKLLKLVGPTVSPIDAVVHGAELIYLHRLEAHPKTLELGAALALLAQTYNFHGIATENRGSNIAMAMMRDAGTEPPTGITYPPAEDDPAIKTEYINTDQPVSTEVFPADITPPPVQGARRGVETREKINKS